MIIVDTHLHLHRCFDMATTLQIAAGNLLQAAHAANAEAPLELALCLTESDGVHAFNELKEMAGVEASDGGWSVRATPEAYSLQLTHQDGTSLWLFAGRQIVTTDGLEVLCLGRDAQIPDRSGDTASVVRHVNALGAIAVVPWGFGKWRGRRGSVVRALLSHEAPRPLWFGDNSGRLQLSREPELFAEGRRAGVAVLAGSDPLPFRSQMRVAGRYAVLLEGTLQPDAPFEIVKAGLSTTDGNPVCCGRRENLLRFVCMQVAMQIKKRLSEGYIQH